MCACVFEWGMFLQVDIPQTTYSLVQDKPEKTSILSNKTCKKNISTGTANQKNNYDSNDISH